MNNVLLVVGLSSVGKSTVLEEAMHLTATAYENINYGDRIVDIAREEAVAEDRDELRNLDAETQKRIPLQVAEDVFVEALAGADAEEEPPFRQYRCRGGCLCDNVG